MTVGAQDAEVQRLLDLLRRPVDVLPSTEDVLATHLPLLRQVTEIHAKGLVAPLQGLDDLNVTAGRIWFENARARPRRHAAAVEAITARSRLGAIEVVGSYRRTEDGATTSVDDLQIGSRGGPPSRPVYLPGYVSWEHELGHHDALTDIFVLGLLLASSSTGIDLSTEEGVRELVAHRNDLRRLNPALHPVADLVIRRMTELDRHARQQDLAGAIRSLERRREQDALGELDLSRFRGFVASRTPDRREKILSHLQSRLHERSRRNRLLHFRATSGSLNLTTASVPLVLEVDRIKPTDLVTWSSGNFAEHVLSGKTVALSRWLRLEDYPYAAPALDRARLDAARDAAEYGFSQLRLVLCFLHWHDLKNAPEERISSPLLLLPVRVSKKKGVRDSHNLQALTETAEVNPVLRHHLKQLYGLVLPEAVDASDPKAIDELHRVLTEQITASAPGVTLEKLERPRIDFVQAVARRTLEMHQRRARLNPRAVRSRSGLDYGYGRDRRLPLGIQLFRLFVSPSAAPQRNLLEDPKPRIFRVRPEVRSVERQTYQLLDGSGRTTPHQWTFDLCSVTLANFNYRKMSLVGDYAAMLREPRSSTVFDTLFPGEARPRAPEVEPTPLGDRYTVVDGDVTQNHAIAVARSGASFIVQGPPGTGKSQTIANLIADYMGRGKRVLFVSEKRAAIDVVYRRLQQQGLSRLCCVIHDSQEDKKSFVLALKESYESWIDGAARPDVERARRSALDAVRAEERRLEQFTLEMMAPAAGARAPLVEVIRRSIALGPPPELTPDERALLPDHRTFADSEPTLRQIGDELRRRGDDPVLARHPARLVRGASLEGPRAAEECRERVRQARSAITAVSQRDPEATALLAVTDQRAALARRLVPLARARVLALLDHGSALHARVKAGLLEIQRRVEEHGAAMERALGWRNPLRRDETEAALDLARRIESRFYRFVLPSYWRLRRLVRERFDFSAWAVRPSLTATLERLLARHETERIVEERRRLLAEETGVDDIRPLFEIADTLSREELGPHERAFCEALSRPEVDAPLVDRLVQFAGSVAAIDELLVDWRRMPPAILLGELDVLEAQLGRLADVLPVLRLVDGLPSSLAAAVRSLPLELEGLEAAICQEAVRASAGVRRRDLDGAALELAHERLVAEHVALRQCNAAVLVEQCRVRFLDRVKISGTPAAGLSPEHKALKKTYAAGRRELEHEFGKVMRFRPIRDLVSGAPGVVVRDLRPVWLMSPLSVADALPLAQDFDVVVVDEASQIPLEDALPALERGRQMIIVGDDKQLPPTSFFRARTEDGEDAGSGEDGEDGDETSDLASLDADSLLDHAARAMPSTMLGWHYRSRDESLISFCNQAFYEGRLLTAPSVKLLRERPEIRARGALDAEAGAQALLERSLSHHRMEGAVYAARRNAAEAEYIAGVIRSLLMRQTGSSIGVVAFSEAQQGEIEQAIRRLTDDDAAFRALYEAEVERVDDGQFNGLFVKNLENVQGDERDIMILSVCYGPDRDGKMLMNFGPINQRGGERRLNVVFSRAKEHMAVVCSFDWTKISNDFNDGAACLKGYLRYVTAMSKGDASDASAVLDGLARTRGTAETSRARDPIAADLARALRERGWEVDLDVGASRFRCDVAVKEAGASAYRLGVLIDSEAHYATPDVDDRYRAKPGVLRTFGWNIRWVLARDWLVDKEGVIARLQAALVATSSG